MVQSLRIATLLILAAACGAAAPLPPLYTQWINYTPANGFPPGEVYCVAPDGNRVWAGTANGLVLLENGRVKKVFTTADGLAGDAVMSVAVDKMTGDVWVGALGGLSRYSGGRFKNYTNLSSGLANDLVYGVAVQGRYVWVATAAGVNRFDTYSGDWSIWNETNAPFNEPWCYGIAVTKKKVYVAAWGGGVLVYDLAGHYWKPYTDPDHSMEIVLYRNEGLIHNIVSGIAYNPELHMFWASTYFGLSGFDGRNWHNYLTKDSGLASNFISAVQSRGSEVWACTQKGLSEFDYKTKIWVTYRPVNWRALDAAKAVKDGSGEIIMSWPDGKKRKIETPTSLAHNYILNVAFQGKDIWVATAQGLSHGIVEPQQEKKLYDSFTNGR